MRPVDVRKELNRRGYMARQNGLNVSLNLTLGGKQLNKPNFKGLILLNPYKKLVFGAGAQILIEFRKLVMVDKGNNEWERLEGVAGPPDGRVEVDFCFNSSGEVEQRIFCNVGEERIFIQGIAEKLDFDSEAGYDWNEIELFLKKLNNKLNTRSADTLLQDNNYLPCKEDVDAAELQVRKTTSGEVIDLDAVLDQVKTDFEKAGKSIKENWREITKQKIPIWFGKNTGGPDAA